jgi:multidrug efflux pump
LQNRADQVPGVKLYLQPVQDLTIDTETGLTPYRFALKGADQNAVNEWGNKLAVALQGVPRCAMSTPRCWPRPRRGGGYQPRCRRASGVTALSIDNALYDAFGQRIISTIYTQSSQNRVILQATPQMLSDPPAWRSCTSARAGRRCRWARSPRCMRRGPAGSGAREPVPQATIGFDVAPGVSLGGGQRHREGGEADRPARLGLDRLLGVRLGLPVGAGQ